MSTDPTAPGAADLAALCLDYVRREEAVLAATREGLARVRAALVSAAPDARTEALRLQEELARERETLRGRRDELRRLAAAALGVPAEAVTLDLVAGCLPGEAAAEVRAALPHLRRLAAEVDERNRQVAVLTWFALDLVRRLLVEATGGQDCGRYGPAGVRRQAAYGTILQARG